MIVLVAVNRPEFLVGTCLPIAASCLAWACYDAMTWAIDCEMVEFCLRDLMLGMTPSVLLWRCWWSTASAFDSVRVFWISPAEFDAAAVLWTGMDLAT